MSNIPDPAVYRRLNRDRRISHGAFRLWHCLRDHANAAGKAWPSQRTIAEAIGCKVHSLRRWLTELVKAGYLRIRNTGQNHHFEYQLLPGEGADVLPEAATRGPAQNGNTNDASCCPSGRSALPKAATPRVALKGNGSNPIEVNPGSKGAPPFTKSLNLYPREMDRLITDQKNEIKRTPVAEAEKLDALCNRLGELETQKYGCPVSKQKHPQPTPSPCKPRPENELTDAQRQSMAQQLAMHRKRLASPGAIHPAGVQANLPPPPAATSQDQRVEKPD